MYLVHLNYQVLQLSNTVYYRISEVPLMISDWKLMLAAAVQHLEKAKPHIPSPGEYPNSKFKEWFVQDVQALTQL